MPTVFTRRELFDLAWSQPRTKLAKEIGVSDVAVGKQCAAARIPAPPAGYWAKVDAGRKMPRPELPLRLPGQANQVVFGQERRKSFYPMLLVDGPLHPPVFVEDLEEQVSSAVKRIGKVTRTNDLLTPDPALSRLPASEARRREKAQSSGWSMDRPYFDGEVHQRHLRIFNSIARAL